MKRLSLLIILPLLCVRTFAQVWGVDPLLPGIILLWTQKADSLYKHQQRRQIEQQSAHLWYNDEVNKITKFHEEFNDYLDSFQDVLAVSAQIYGFYHEFSELSANIQGLSKQIENAPDNALAVALDNRRNDIYMDITNRSVGIVNNIRKVCIDTKMTQADRQKLVFKIRPQLKELNKRLLRLQKLVKYTTLDDVWNNIMQREHPMADKSAISREAMRRWKTNYQKIKY